MSVENANGGQPSGDPAANNNTQQPVTTPAEPNTTGGGDGGAVTTPATQPQPATETISPSELKALRDRLKAAEAAEAELKQRKDAELTETERLKKQNDERETELKTLKDQMRESAIERSVEQAARALKFADPADALALVRHKLELDDKGKPTNLDDVLKEVAKAKPYLLVQTEPVVKPAPNAGTPANPSRQQPLTKDMLKRMTADEINARWTEVSELMKQG